MSTEPLGAEQEVTGFVFPMTLMGGLLFGIIALAVAVQPLAEAVTVTM